MILQTSIKENFVLSENMVILKWSNKKKSI